MPDIPIVAQPLRHSNADPAKRLVSDSSLKFRRPWIAAGALKFTWPIGTEAFRISGQALLGIHRYIGGNTPDVHVIHFHEGRIEISGTLPGLTSAGNMVSLQDVVTSRNRKTLALPGILPKVQYVVIESYDFSHGEDDRTSSIPYTLAMVRTGNTGASAGGGGGSSALEAFQDASGAPSTPQRGSTSESSRTFTVTEGVDTLAAIADRVYGDVNQWAKLVDLNRSTLVNNNPSLQSVNVFQLPYFRWPVGSKIAF